MVNFCSKTGGSSTADYTVDLKIRIPKYRPESRFFLFFGPQTSKFLILGELGNPRLGFLFGCATGFRAQAWPDVLPTHRPTHLLIYIQLSKSPSVLANWGGPAWVPLRHMQANQQQHLKLSAQALPGSQFLGPKNKKFRGPGSRFLKQ